MGLFTGVIDAQGFVHEMKAVEILEDNIPSNKLDLLMNVWKQCPDFKYSQKAGDRYTAVEIAEIFRKKCDGQSFAKRHINVFVEYQMLWMR